MQSYVSDDQSRHLILMNVYFLFFIGVGRPKSKLNIERCLHVNNISPFFSPCSSAALLLHLNPGVGFSGVDLTWFLSSLSRRQFFHQILVTGENYSNYSLVHLRRDDQTERSVKEPFASFFTEKDKGSIKKRCIVEKLKPETSTKPATLQICITTGMRSQTT